MGNADAVFKPGWVGVHTLDGLIASGASAYKFPVYETDEPIVDPNGNGGTGHDYVYEGDLNVYPVAGADTKSGKSLVLWTGGSTGFGVFEVENSPAAVVTAPTAITVDENREVTLSSVISGSPNKYLWSRNGTEYTLTVNGVKDVSANANTIAANATVTFKAPGLTAGYGLWEMYRGTDGTGHFRRRTFVDGGFLDETGDPSRNR